MINPHWLELPMSRINFHGPKDVRAIEVLMYATDGTKGLWDVFPRSVSTFLIDDKSHI